MTEFYTLIHKGLRGEAVLILLEKFVKHDGGEG